MIKLKSLLENDLKEFREGFDLESFLKMSSFRQQVMYANQNLRRIASGSARIVYEIDDKKVLKLAKNAKGLAQNEAEGDWYVNESYGDIIAKVLERDENYRWIVSERAKKITPNEFKSIVGVDFKDFYEYIVYIVGKDRYYTEPSQEIKDKLEDDEFASEVADFIGSTDASTGDLQRISTYGKIDDRVVIIDYGLTMEIFKKYYQRH